MDFQAQIGTWLAAHLLARMPVGGRFGLANTALPVSIQLETGDGLDDIRLQQDDAGRIDLQSKTSAGLANSPNSPLGKTIRQLVRVIIDARAAGVAIDPSKARALLAVEVERRWWRRVLSRFLSLVSLEAIATDPMRALREELAAADELAGNPPTRSMSVRRESSRSVARSLLAGEGVDVEKGIDAQMLSRSEALYEKVKATASASDGAALAELWADVLATIAFYDAHTDTLHSQVEQPVWGNWSAP